MKTNTVKSNKKYEKMHRQLIDYIMSGQIHSTLIGRTISLNNSSSSNDLRDVKEFVEYMINLIKKAEDFGKDNVKDS